MPKRKRSRRRDFWRREYPDGSVSPNYWTNLFGERVSTGFPSLEAAKRWKEARLLEGADPRRAAAEKASLEDAVRELYAELRRRGRSKATLKRAEQKLGHFVRLWGADCKLADINARAVGHYIDARLLDPGARTGSTVARITIRDELAFLRQMLVLARRQGLYALAIEDVLPTLFETGHKPKKTWCKERDLPRLLRQFHLQDRAAHIAWIVATGSRYSESLRAMREDVDLTNYRVLIRGSKTVESWKTITIPSRMRKWLRYALLLVDKERTTRPMFDAWGQMVRDMKAACLRAGIPQVGPHDLRRTFGKWLRLHGFDLDTIAKLLRHTTDKLAREVYADVEGDELATVVENAEAMAVMSKTRTRPPQKDGNPR